MGVSFDLSYCELRCKEVVNSIDGKRLGRILDIIFNSCGEIKGIVAPYGRKGFFLKCQEIYIPWCCIRKIGEDVILVDIKENFGGGREHRRGGKHKKYDFYDYGRDDFGYGGYYDDYGPVHLYGEKSGQDKDTGASGGQERRDDRQDRDYVRQEQRREDAGREQAYRETYRESERPDCDGKCEKCMLFDCLHRWKDRDGVYVDNKRYK